MDQEKGMGETLGYLSRRELANYLRGKCKSYLFRSSGGVDGMSRVQQTEKMAEDDTRKGRYLTR